MPGRIQSGYKLRHDQAQLAALEGMDGFKVEMDIQPPARLGAASQATEWCSDEGYPLLHDVIGLGISIKSEDWTGTAHEFMKDLDRKTK